MKNTKIRIEPYKYSTRSKKKYLARKKLITRRLKFLKKIYKNSRGYKKAVYSKEIKSLKEDIKILNTMYRYYKKNN